ncbi:MAG TPA: hypothetical protein VJS38_10320 [Phenylobacterium sp.]|uniref:hypothetical protein n=1 Tax=Phenylobacterium sp. TaxID=1871053 RepID=UPI002B491CA4|nr:hypothetical protein [Phenylobacterium sp.]HKR88559.1 hypothetical protein [Phenylobacterium sp.]
MPKHGDAVELAANTGVLGHVGRALLQVADWYAGCSTYYPLERPAPDVARDGRERPDAGSRHDLTRRG